MSPTASIDLNADVGESFGRWTLGDDAAMMRSITSANIACGFHAGDPTTMRRTCAIAVDHGVTIGAHVSYRDLAGFGRRYMEISSSDLAADVLYQLGALAGMAHSVGGRVRYVKPHGALYHAVTDHRDQAAAVVAATAAFDPTLTMLAFPGSVILRLAEAAGLPTATEAFADRRYRDGRLVDRSEGDALITDPDEAADAALVWATGGAADSLCLHGDTPGAATLAARVRAALAGGGVAVRPFVG